ncbi:DDE-type integrase/transposase/recombinase [Lipingzhangella halophila]|uniref:DDE-type integrase/transposase/recombinase n=1 Tax=Lipingzhangella halophila TaxID=1783352 RepID=UPI0016230DE6
MVQRRFHVARRDRLWLTDTTEHPTHEGKLYCAAVMDAYSRRVIGWSMDGRQDTDLVVNALAMAVARRTPLPRSTILHLRPRDPVHVVGIRDAVARCRTSRVDGNGG